MTINSTLPVSTLVQINVTLTAQAAQGQNLSTLLFLGTSSIIDTYTRMRSYSTLAAVAADFGTSAPEYLAASLWFGQSPQPPQISLGRWVNAASSGQLIGGSIPSNEEAIAFWNAITAGSFHVTIDGGGPQSLTGLNFSGASNLNGVAALINAVLTGAVISWNPIYNRFTITSNSTGATSTVSFVTAGAGGTDISGDLGMLSTSSGCFQAPGLAAESALAAVTLFDQQFGQQWYAVVIPDVTDTDQVAISSYIDGSNNKHFLGCTTQEAGALVSGNTSNLGYLLQQNKTTKYAVQYSSTNPYAIVSALARILPTNWNGVNTALTLAYKQEPGVTPENLTQSQYAALLSYGINVYAAFNNNTAVFLPGVAGNSQWIDTVIGIDALAVGLQTNGFNLLYQTPTKIPQTDPGVNQIIAAFAQICQQFVTNGLIAPGTWNSAGFGSLNQGDTVPKGYYIYGPPVSTQAPAVRATRVSVAIAIAVKLAGAVQDILCNVTVNQ